MRANTYVIHCSLIEQKNRANITDIVTLPFDDELKGTVDFNEAMEVYNAAVAAGYFQNQF